MAKQRVNAENATASCVIITVNSARILLPLALILPGGTKMNGLSLISFNVDLDTNQTCFKIKIDTIYKFVYIYVLSG
jgi:hypothetical protein